MNDSEKISVIVPVYKVEQFLEQCIQSIVKQTYRNIEIILVDDGSPDDCYEICSRWKKKDSRIIVIHKENGGLSDARNAGVAVATGKYVAFVDGDDHIHNEMLQMLYENMHRYNSDISACGVEKIWQNGKKIQMLTPKGCCILDNEEAMQAIIEETWLKQPVWYKLYKRELIKDIKFPVGKYHEDVFWSYQAVARANKVSVFDKVGYYYMQHESSIMGQGYSLKRLDVIEGKCQRLEYIKRYYPQLEEIALCDLLFSCIYHGQKVLRELAKNEAAEVIKYLNNVIEKNRLLKSVYRVTSMKKWLWISCAKISFFNTCKLRNYLGIGL